MLSVNPSRQLTLPLAPSQLYPSLLSAFCTGATVARTVGAHLRLHVEVPLRACLELAGRRERSTRRRRDGCALVAHRDGRGPRRDATPGGGARCEQRVRALHVRGRGRAVQPDGLRQRRHDDAAALVLLRCV
jgi:hypothetical protein